MSLDVTLTDAAGFEPFEVTTSDKTVTPAINLAYLGWALGDNAASTAVTGNLIDGVLTGGNTSAVAETLNGHAAFHLSGSGQYVTVPLHVQLADIRADEVQNLWSKYLGNPVIGNNGTGDYVQFGQMVRNPAGGWYFFGCSNSAIYRWESDDLKTWTNKTLAMAGGGVGAWDQYLQVCSPFQRESDGLWMMLYRGFNGISYHIGLATSLDGLTWTRKDNGGVSDGLFSQFGNNYDPVGIILVGSRYYVFVNGYSDHGISSVYYSDDDFGTFTSYSNNPIFSNSMYCGTVFKRGSYYYFILPWDLTNISSSAVYDHRLAFFRSTDPTFDPATREYLGCAIVNDQTYDQRYLDTPTVPTVDVRRELSTEFGDTLWMMYSASDVSSLTHITQALASTQMSAIDYLPPIQDLTSSLASQMSNQVVSFSFWARFDTLTTADPIFSAANIPAGPGPAWLMDIKASGGRNVFTLYAGGGYRFTEYEPVVNRTYHIAVVENKTDKRIYINGALIGVVTQDSTTIEWFNLYMGMGFGGRYMDGYVWDFRIYSKELAPSEIQALYNAGKPTVDEDTDYGADLALNGGFETAGAGELDVFASWSETISDGLIEQTANSGEVYAGSYACKMTAGTAKATVLSQDHSVAAGEQYRLQMFVAGDGTIAGRYAVYDATHASYIGMSGYVTTGISVNTYAMVTKDFTIPAGCTQIKIFLRCPDRAGSSCLLDTVTLRKKIA